MSEKTWSQRSGWEKAWEVAKVVGGIAVFVLLLAVGKPGKPVRRPRVPVWKPKIYGPVGGPKGWNH